MNISHVTDTNHASTDESAESSAAKPEQPHETGSTGGDALREAETPDGASVPDEDADFSIVGIAASAGGLSASKALFECLPDQNHAAFVLIQHLAPDHDSEIAAILQNHTKMSVMEATDGMQVRPNHVYVIPPGKAIEMNDETLVLSDPEEARGQRFPADSFLRSLAKENGHRILSVIPSGTGSDGTLGTKAVKEAAGICLAQDPSDAEYASMPERAIATGQVDVIGTADRLAERLSDYIEGGADAPLPNTLDSLPPDDSEAFQRIMTTVRKKTGSDFSSYKRSTILRRIARRMQVNRVYSLGAYLRVLNSKADEVNELFKDFLISVTDFFRDPEAFKKLEREVIPTLFAGKDVGDSVRVWVAGCATGEEAYSVAMLLMEQTETMERPPQVQVFATDLDEDALEFARRGLYPTSITADVSQARLNRFFVEQGDAYRVSSLLKDVVLFASHNMLQDPPFSDLDLITCRNVLIYLRRDVQEQLVDRFHYALNEDRYLFLGSSESLDNVSNLFSVISKKHRICQRRTLPERTPQFFQVRTKRWRAESDAADALENSSRDTSSGLGKIHSQLMLEEYAPPSVLVNEDSTIVHLFGDVGQYLRLTEGVPTHDLLDKVGDTLRLQLRPALYRAFHRGEKVDVYNVSAGGDEEPQVVNVHVRPLNRPDVSGKYVQVVFEPVDEPPDALRSPPDAGEASREVVDHLEQELERTKERLQSVTEEFETSNEELKASNEELQSMNEELRSTTEELETSKEELQSTNEELVTVNQELKDKIEELNEANADLENLLASSDVGTIFLDREMKVKRFTPDVTSLFNLMPQDKGRPIGHVSNKLKYEHLLDDAKEVLKTLEPIEQETAAENGSYYLARILPYRTREDQVDGVVMTFINITDRKEAEEEVRTRAKQQKTLANLGQSAISSTDIEALKQDIVESVAEVFDAGYCFILQLKNEALHFDVGVGVNEDDVEDIAYEVSRSSQAGYTLGVESPVVINDFEEGSSTAPAFLSDRGLSGGMSVVIQGEDEAFGILSVHTEQKKSYTNNDANFLQSVANLISETIRRHRGERNLRKAKEGAEAAAEAKSAFLANISHDLRTPLTALMGFAQLLEERLDEDKARMASRINDSALQLKSTLDALLRFARDGNELAFHAEKADLAHHVDRIVSTLEDLAEEGVQVSAEYRRDGSAVPMSSAEFDVSITTDVTVLQRILNNLLGNAIKFTSEGTVRVRARDAGDRFHLLVADTGCGMSPDFLERAFEPFEQQRMGANRTHEGHGLGLSIVRKLVEGMGGSIQVRSREGEGSVFRVDLPKDISEHATVRIDTSRRDATVAGSSERVEPDASGGEGTTSAEASTDAGDTESEPEDTERRPRILVLEDNANTQAMLDMLLRDPFDVVIRSTYAGALEAARTTTFDALLLDIPLDGTKTGVDVLNDIHALPGYGAVPAIACTAFASDRDASSFLSEGFDACVPKPIDTNDLVALLTNVTR